MVSRTAGSGIPGLSQAKAVGQGFNVYGALSSESLVRPLVDPTKAGTTVFNFQGVDYTIPDYVVGVEDPSSYVIRTVSETREEAQNALSVHAGVGGSYGAFSGEMEADFSFERNTSSDSYFCYWRSVNSLAVLETNPDLAKKAISDDFAAAVDGLPLPLSEENKEDYFDFFAVFGPFYTRHVTLGGNLTFLNQVTRNESITKASVELSVKAQYDGLYATGKLDLSGITTNQWSSYRDDSRVMVEGVGGDQALLAQLAGVDPWHFSKASADLATAWTRSLGSAAGLVDFDLGGVWELISDPERAAAVQEAWQLYSEIMHLKISVQSWSTGLPWPCDIPARPPILISDKVIKPKDPPASPVGAQVIVLDGNNAASPHGVLLDRYYCLPVEYAWPMTYQAMWDKMAADLEGYDQRGNILLMVTFGQFLNMPPTDSALAMFETAGASAVVQDWITHCDPGSQQDDPSVWTAFPRVYALAGVFGHGPGTGIEAFIGDYYDGSPSLDMTVYLYRQAYGGQYVLGAG
ncbi:MAC/perforin domain-containing protein [Streptomyces sp. NPDC093094]|uniref:MAC/perforin domain-containing protein n=1 Tax=Streptomyces sp. NPDC093094 TaxID=3366026 RepID=UPI00380996E6